MKKIIPFLFICLSFSGFAQKGYRYSVVPGTDNTFLMTSKEAKAVAYSATIALVPTQEEENYNFATLTGSLTLTTGITKAYTTDRMTCIFLANGSNQTVTFSTGFTSNGTLVVPASNYSIVQFVFNGVTFVETTRQNMAAGAFNSLTTNSITETTAGSGVTINKQVIQNYTATTYTATGSYTVTAAAVEGGLLVAATSTATTTWTLPTAALLATQVSATAGTTLFFEVINNGASNGTVTVAVGAGIVASDFPGSNTLTRTGSATVGIAGFRITFISASAAVLTRIF